MTVLAFHGRRVREQSHDEATGGLPARLAVPRLGGIGMCAVGVKSV